ncbi:MAG TPA: CHRD domain-containing protein, partial [Thermomicrobiales bacterium]|nr:CHRD domain-containing protein [Thermomicrobiales bacterium]
LTYTPGNPAGWLVEAGNVGQHYHNWRHGDGMPPLPEERLFYAILSGDQEVPPVETEASGVASFFLSDDGLTLHYHITFDGLTDVTMGHIHSGAVGVNGGIIAWLYPASGPPASEPTDLDMVAGTITANDLPDGTSLFDLVEMLATGDTYVNFHTTDHPGGEVRGQIQRPENKLFFFAMLTNDQEVVSDPAPQPDTGATGMTTLRYHQADGAITCETVVNDIVDVTMAHIHLAPIGSNGGVITWLFPADGPPPSAPITPDGELECATITEDRLIISEAVEAQIGGTSLEAFVYQMLIGNTYVNVHTSEFPDGEIRGQIWLD